MSRLAQPKGTGTEGSRINTVTIKMILGRIKEYFDLRQPWKNPFRKFDKK